MAVPTMGYICIYIDWCHVASSSFLAAKNYVKINYGNYLLELDLVGDIQDTHVKAVSKAGVLLVKLKKVREDHE